MSWRAYDAAVPGCAVCIKLKKLISYAEVDVKTAARTRSHASTPSAIIRGDKLIAKYKSNLAGQNKLMTGHLESVHELVLTK